MADVKKTPEQIAAEKKAQDEKSKANKKRNEVRNSAFATLKELADKQPDKKYKDALAVLRPSLYGMGGGGGRSGGISIHAKLAGLITEKGSISEDEIFKNLKMGRKECNGSLRHSLRKSAPDTRVWISFNGETGIYKVEGKGATPPKNWNGYVPIDENIELK